jgi:serine protease Do
VPIAAAEKLRMDYIRFGKLRHGWIGVHVESLPQAAQGSSVSVSHLDPDTPAAKSGLRDGDILVQVGNVKINSIEDVLDASFYLTAGDTTQISFMRAGRVQTVSVKSVEDPATVSDAETSVPNLVLTPPHPLPSPSPLLTGTDIAAP